MAKLITCPDCGTKFTVKANVLGPDGRKLKCFRCGHIWMQGPDAPDAPEQSIAAPLGAAAQTQPMQTPYAPPAAPNPYAQPSQPPGFGQGYGQAPYQPPPYGHPGAAPSAYPPQGYGQPAPGYDPGFAPPAPEPEARPAFGMEDMAGDAPDDYAASADPDMGAEFSMDDIPMDSDGDDEANVLLNDEPDDDLDEFRDILGMGEGDGEGADSSIPDLDDVPLEMAPAGAEEDATPDLDISDLELPDADTGFSDIFDDDVAEDHHEDMSSSLMGTDDIDEPMPEVFSAPPASSKKGKKKKGGGAGCIVTLLLLSLLGGGGYALYAFQDAVLEMVPQLKPVYEMVGLKPQGPVTLSEYGVARRQNGNGLVINATIVNGSEDPQVAPHMRVIFENADGDEVQRLDVAPPQRIIAPGAQMQIEGFLEQPSPDIAGYKDPPDLFDPQTE